MFDMDFVGLVAVLYGLKKPLSVGDRCQTFVQLATLCTYINIFL